ncbi:MAG: TIR domain-containing protein, partial [Chloroflexota bacterium]|nr:TIR domain-containing protein [Chloroflexota bacterium]
MKATKAFISYSWSNREHEEWVLDLATRLRESGVDAILDKWDLKEGQEANAFMEKMVSDTEITKVVIVSDKAYAERSNSRKGGAGTEAQIISKELYEKENQNKFAALVVERDNEGEPYLPAYYASRK